MTATIFKLFKRESRCAVDIGAGIGDFGVIASDVFDNIFSFDCDRSAIKHVRANLELNHVSNVEIEQRKVESLNFLFEKKKVDKIDLLKIDCEGCEYKIIENTKEKYIDKIKNMSMEAHLWNSVFEKRYRRMKNILISHGFVIEEEENPVHGYLKFLFARKAF